MKRRVALARVLMMDPAVVLLDEPTAGLNPVRRNAVYSIIVAFPKKYGFTAIMISREVPGIFFLSQRIAMLDGVRSASKAPPKKFSATRTRRFSFLFRG